MAAALASFASVQFAWPRWITWPPPHACRTGSFHTCNASIGALHLSQLLTYEPTSRFWDFQWYETGIFVVLAAALAWFCT